MADQKQKKNELDIFNQWKRTQDPKHFQELYGSMKNLIHDASRKAAYGSNIPESAHRVWAAQNFLEALKTFSPGKGAALQTHVHTAVHQKAKRLNYLYQNLGSISEQRATQVGLYQSEYQNMRDKLNREPSAAEIADQLGWSTKMVGYMQKELRKDLALGEGTEDTPFFESSVDEEILDYVYYELSPQEQVVYDYIFGKHGRQKFRKPSGKIDFARIGSQMGVTESKARSLSLSIREKLSKALKR